MEKAMKAFLLAKTNSYPRTHKLVDLVGECEAIEPDFSQFRPDCIVVDQYYIPTRYPNGIPGGLPEEIPGPAEAEEATQAGERILHLVTQKLS